MSCSRIACSCWYWAGLRIFCNCGALSLWMARSCLIFCIGGSEGLFLIASNLGASALRIGSTSTSCFGVSLSCRAKAITLASASGFWPGAAGTGIRNARRQAVDVKSVKGVFMAAICSALRDLPIGPKSYEEACDRHRHLRTAPQAHSTPNGHRRVENHRRPQRHSVQPQADAGESEDSGGGNVIHQHRNDQSSGSAALRVIARQPAGDTEREQRGSRDAREHHRGGCAER